jgi:hypothetical protein
LLSDPKVREIGRSPRKAGAELVQSRQTSFGGIDQAAQPVVFSRWELDCLIAETGRRQGGRGWKVIQGHQEKPPAIIGGKFALTSRNY